MATQNAPTDVPLRTTTYLDKPRFIAHTKKILTRLRRQKILVDDIVNQINQHQIPLTRSRFIDLFTSRPDRLTMAMPQLIVVFVHVCFSYDATILRADEVIDFADAARLPLRFYSQFSVYFPAHEWQKAWFNELPTTKPYLNRATLIGREAAFERGLLALVRGKHFVITGCNGVGKTAFAEALVFEYELLTTTKIPVITLQQPLRTPQELLLAIAAAADIHPLTNEPVSLRFHAVFARKQTAYILLDGWGDTEEARGLLSAFLQQYASVRLILVTPELRSLPYPNTDAIAHEELLPLPDDVPHSAAMMLYLRTYRQNGGTYTAADLPVLHRDCQTANGIARDIVSAAQQRTTVLHTPHTRNLEQLLTQLTITQLHIIAFLSTFDSPISASFVSAYHAEHADPTHIADACTALRAAALLENRHTGEGMVYVVPDTVRTAYRASYARGLSAGVSEDLFQGLCRYGATAELPRIAAVHKSDISALITLLHAVSREAPDQHVLIIKLLNSWLAFWLYHHVGAHVILIAQPLLLQQHTAHHIRAELLLTTSRIHLFYGQYVDASHDIAHMAPLVNQTHYHVVWARGVFVALELATQTNHTAEIARILPCIADAQRILDDEDAPLWAGYAHTTIAAHLLRTHDIPAAIVANTVAQQCCTLRAPTSTYIESKLQRSLLYVCEGKYWLARACLEELESTFTQHEFPSLHASVHMRLAAVDALMHNPDQAAPRLLESLNILKHRGNLSELLWLADIYSLVYAEQHDIAQALRINTLCTHVRTRTTNPRIPYIEALIARKRAKIPASLLRQHANTLTDETIYDLIDLLDQRPIS